MVERERKSGPGIVGVTGGIGSGKSTVGRMLENFGQKVIDVDKIAHDLAAQGSPVLADIAGIFGSDVIRKNGELDRDKVSGIAFHNPAKRHALEALLHPGAMGDDVEPPLLEVPNLVLGFADDDLDNCLFHPPRLALKPLALLGILFSPRRGAYHFQLCPPVRHYSLVHPGTGDLIDADEHGLARFPAGGAVFHEIGRDFFESVTGGDDFIILAEKFLEKRLFIRVQVGPSDCLGDAVIEIQPGDTELLTAILIDQLHSRPVLLGAFEVVPRNVASKDTPREGIVFVEGGAREADVSGIG